MGAALVVTMTAAIALAVPASAAAADFFVNEDPPGSDANNCTSPATPCSSVSGGLAKANASPGSGDTIWVDGGSHNASVVLGDGNSLMAQDFDTSDDDTPGQQPLLVGLSGWPVITVANNDPAGTVEGFRIQQDGNWAVQAADSLTLVGNTLDSIGDGNPGIIITGATGTPPVVRNNVLDAEPDPLAIGILITGSAPTITGNELRDMSAPITVTATAPPTITDNTITGLMKETGTAYGIKVEQGASPTLRGNVIRDPDASSTTVGVSLENDMSVADVDAELERNRILGQDTGVLLRDSAAITLHSDLIAQNTIGLDAADSGVPESGGADVSATNVTIFDNGTDIKLSGNQLTLDSSIVEDLIDDGSTAQCTIAFSAGPAAQSGCSALAGAPGDAGFDYGLPTFADAQYHLPAGSPLIDVGNPTSPGAPAPPPAYNPGSLDFDGQPREQDGNCDENPRRDVGADEFAPNCQQPPAGGGGGAGGGQDQPKADGTLTIDANKGKVEKGRKVLLSGQLDVAANESCEQNRQIQIQRRLKSEDDSKFATFQTVNTDATGNYSLKVKVKKTNFYRAVVAETDACDDETSNSQKVRVQKKKAAQEA
jgi:hypothetical protein